MAVLRVSLLLDFNVPSIVTLGQSNITKNKNWINEDKQNESDLSAYSCKTK